VYKGWKTKVVMLLREGGSTGKAWIEGKAEKTQGIRGWIKKAKDSRASCGEGSGEVQGKLG
jgi:hypothetical protein